MRKTVMPREARPVLALGCTAVLVTLSCTGCFSLTTKPKPPGCPAAAPSATAAAGDTAGAASNTVVLIDTTASYWPAKGGSAQLAESPQTAAVSELMTDYGKAGTNLVSLGTFNGSSTTITWQLTDAVLPIPYGTGKTIDTFKKVAAGCLGNMVKQAVKAEPAAGGTDVMAALDAAGEQIGSTSPGNSHVMIITDGLSNTGCLNLNQVFSVGESAASVVRTCPGQGGIARLRGVSLELAGVGVQAQSKPLPSSDQTWLVRYWRDVCTALGVKQAQSCVSTEGDAGVRASDLNRPLDPPISFPGISRPGRDILPADLLFAFDSATLTPTAQAYLDILVPQIRSRGLSVTKIVGHTDPVGSAAYNRGLSLRRAQAVQAYLSEQGLTGSQAQGVGFSQPACPSSGRPSAACLAKDRRVVIFLEGHT